MHQFIGESGRGVKRAERTDCRRGVARLFFEFSQRGRQRFLTAFEFSRGKLQQPIGDGDAKITHHGQTALAIDRYDRHRTRMTDNVPLKIDSRRIGQRETLDVEHMTSVKSRSLAKCEHWQDHR